LNPCGSGGFLLFPVIFTTRFFFLLRKKAPRHHADVPGGFAIWRKQGDAVRPAGVS